MPKKRFDRIEEAHQEFIEAQHMYWVWMASPAGRVNLAPRVGFAGVMGTNRVIWLNLTGSENETAAHLRESSRMTLNVVLVRENAQYFESV